LAFEAIAADVQKALNDLPSLSNQLVKVTQNTSDNVDSKLFTIEFPSIFGDVSAISEVSGNVLFTSSELVKGAPSGSGFQLLIENQPTNLLNLNDTPSTVISSF
jgi:hypothetical protein